MQYYQKFMGLYFAYRVDVVHTQAVVDSCYYGCIAEVATMVQAFVHPSKVR